MVERTRLVAANLLAALTLGLGLFGPSNQLNGQSIESDLDVKAWFQQVSATIDQFPIPRKIVVARKDSDDPPEVITVKKPWHEDRTFINLVDKTAIDAFKSLNFGTIAGINDAFSSKNWQEEMIKRYRANGVLDVSNGKWRLYFVLKGKVRSIDIATGSANPTGAKILEALVDRLGYSGIVMAKRDGYLLVGELKPIATGKQAFAVRNSHNRFRLKPKAKGTAIVEKKYGWQYLGAYKALLGDDNIAIGTKILHGRSKAP